MVPPNGTHSWLKMLLIDHPFNFNQERICEKFCFSDFVEGFKNLPRQSEMSNGCFRICFILTLSFGVKIYRLSRAPVSLFSFQIETSFVFPFIGPFCVSLYFIQSMK